MDHNSVTLDPANTIWMLLCCILVFAMQPGFTCLESGLIRSKNSINVAAKNFADFALSCALFAIVGYGLIFGNSAFGLFGTSKFVDHYKGGTELIHFLFQMLFCSTAATIVSGAVAERMTFNAYLAVTFVIVVAAYPITAHWIWNPSGLLALMGAHDFAGGTVVHSVGGWCALAAVLLIGARHGRFGKLKLVRQSQNYPFAAFGAFLMWIGWLGFNGGSTFGLTQHTPQIIANTMLGGIAGTVSVLALMVAGVRHANVTAMINASIAGLVAITAGADVISPFGAIVLGALGGLLSIATVAVLERRRIDDGIGIIGVHLTPGILGTLSLPLFANGDFIAGRGGYIDFALAQFSTVALIGVWTFGVSYFFLKALGNFMPLRVSAAAEARGLNQAEHDFTTELDQLREDLGRQIQAAGFMSDVKLDPDSEMGQIAGLFGQAVSSMKQRHEEWRNNLAKLEAANGLLRTRTVDLEQALVNKEAALNETVNQFNQVSGKLAKTLEAMDIWDKDRLHILRNVATLCIAPLNEITGKMRRMRELKTPRTAGQIILSAVAQGGKLVRDLDTVRRVFELEDAHETVDSDIDTRTVLDYIFNSWRSRLGKAELNVNRIGIPLILRGDVLRFTDMFNELMLWHVRRCQTGQFNVNVTSENGRLILQIRDSGAQLADEDIARLLDPVSSLKSEGIEIFAEHGFALALAAKLAATLHAHLSVRPHMDGILVNIDFSKEYCRPRTESDLGPSQQAAVA